MPKSWMTLLIVATLVLVVGVWSQRVMAPEPVTIRPRPGAEHGRSSVALVLALESTRGDTTPSVSIPENIEDLEIRIDLAGESRFTSFDAGVTQSGREVWSSRASEPLKPTPDGALIAVVPLDSGIGARGTYEFTVLGRPAAGEPRLLATIPFVVRRP